MSAYNDALDADHPGMFVNLAMMDIKSQMASLRAYCDYHSLGKYRDAILDLLSELSDLAVAHPQSKLRSVQ
jgi:hypothetical protein